MRTICRSCRAWPRIAVFDGPRCTGTGRARRFGLLLTHPVPLGGCPKAEARRRPYERVRAVLGDRGRDPGPKPGGWNRAMPAGSIPLLSVVWEPGADGTGAVVL